MKRKTLHLEGKTKTKTKNGSVELDGCIPLRYLRLILYMN